MKNDKRNDKIAQDLVDNIFGSIEDEQMPPREQPEVIPEEQLYERVTKNAGEIINNGLDAITSIKTRLASGADADLVEAFSALISSTTGALEVLNKIQLQTRKARATEKLEAEKHKYKMAQIEQKSRLSLGDGDGSSGNTNILIATREDIMASLLKPLREQAKLVADTADQDRIIHQLPQPTGDGEIIDV